MVRHSDHKDIVVWKTVPGPPKISPLVMEAAKKMDNPVPKLPQIAKSAGSIRVQQGIGQAAASQSQRSKKYQRIASALPVRPKPAWPRTKQKRAFSAPPTSKEYSHYKQAIKDSAPDDMQKPTQEKLRAWADNANDYEKQVVYSMLSRAAKPRQGPPATPPSPQEAYHLLLRAKDVPIEQPTPPPHEEGSNDKKASWAPYFKDQRRRQMSQRSLNSAPVKPMLGLIPDATQYPPRDHRTYRLEGQDSRVAGKPDEERELKGQLSTIARVTQKQWRKPDKKYLIAPMHSHPTRRGSVPKDYKCDVSFFQSVRAPFKGHFIIHPDFTSETFVQKKRADQMVSHIRY